MTAKRNLIFLLATLGISVVAYKFGAEILFYPILVLGGIIVFYALSIKCPTCDKRQVFRGLSILDLRFPDDKCYSCGSNLKKGKNNN